MFFYCISLKNIIMYYMTSTLKILQLWLTCYPCFLFRVEDSEFCNRPDLTKNSNYFTQVIKVSWNIIGKIN